MVCRRWERSRKFEKPAKIDNIIKHGKYFGYYVKASKYQLIVKDEKYNEAIKVIKNTEIEMKKRARVLGSVIGSETECKTFLETQLEEHNKILKKTWRDRENISTKRVLLLHQRNTKKYRF